MSSIVVLHSHVPPGAPPDEQDTLVQAREIAAALQRCGHRAILMDFEWNLEAMTERLLGLAPDLAFNLVETAAGSGRFVHLAPTLLDHLAIPYSGSSTESLFLSSNKLEAKRMLRTAAIPTPPSFSMAQCLAGDADLGIPLVLKSVWEHASVGLFAAGTGN